MHFGCGKHAHADTLQLLTDIDTAVFKIAGAKTLVPVVVMWRFTLSSWL
jgi:hypothetical protein